MAETHIYADETEDDSFQPIFHDPTPVNANVARCEDITYALRLELLAATSVQQPSALSSFTVERTQGGPLQPGLLSAPRTELVRLVIRDNHAAVELGVDAADHSKPADYATRQWLQDISVRVPLRVHVRKANKKVPVDLEGSLRLAVAVRAAPAVPSAPSDIKDQTLAAFFQGPWKDRSETNAAALIGAVQANGGHTALAASTGPPPHGITSFVDLPVSTTTSDGIAVGHADVSFSPPPIGGECYQLVLWLLDSGGQDVRGSPTQPRASFVDGWWVPVPMPHLVTSNWFVTWRRVELSALVCVNGTDPDACIDWPRVERTYARAFIVLDRSNAVRRDVDPDTWWKVLQTLLSTPQREKVAKFAEDKLKAHTDMFPGDLRGSEFSADVVHQLAKSFIRAACETVNALTPLPADSRQQRDPLGLFVLLLRTGNKKFSAGEYFGDRMAWFLDQGDKDETTTTFIHEIGHALYLRHSHTIKDQSFCSLGSAQAVQEVIVAKCSSNDYLADHDQFDAFDCVMSYTADPKTTEFCAGCLLTLRFHDLRRGLTYPGPTNAPQAQPDTPQRHARDLFLAGIWSAGVMPVVVTPASYPTKAHFHVTLSRLRTGDKVRLTVLSQPFPTCYNRYAYLNLTGVPGCSWAIVGYTKIPTDRKGHIVNLDKALTVAGAVSKQEVIGSSSALVPDDGVEITALKPGQVYLAFNFYSMPLLYLALQIDP